MQSFFHDAQSAHPDPKRRVFLRKRRGNECAPGVLLHPFVFDGAKKDPSLEEDSPNPLNVYGASKLASNRSNQRACPVASIPTRTLTCLRCRSRVKRSASPSLWFSRRSPVSPVSVSKNATC